MQYRKRAKKTCKEIKEKNPSFKKKKKFSLIDPEIHAHAILYCYHGNPKGVGWWLFVIQYNYVILYYYYHKEFQDWFIYLWHGFFCLNLYFLRWSKNPSPPVCVRNRLGYYSTRHTNRCVKIPSQSFIYEPRKTWPAQGHTLNTHTHGLSINR